MDRQGPNLYENSRYQFERRERKTLILDIVDNTINKFLHLKHVYPNNKLMLSRKKYKIKQ